MKKQYTSPYNPAVKELSDLIIKEAYAGKIPPHVLAKITPVLEGIEVTDKLLVQKDQAIIQKEIEKEQAVRSKSIEKNNLLAQKEQLLIQKDKNLETLKESGVAGEQKEFVDVLHKLYPKWYPERLEDWSSDTWGKQVIDRGDFKTIQANLPNYRQQVLEKEFIDILHELYPSWYPVNFKDWPADSWGKGVVDKKEYKVMEANLPTYKQWLANKKEFIEIIPKLYPESYPANYEEWTGQWGKGLLDKGDYKTIEQSLPIYRKQLARKEFIEILPKLYPNDYPVGFENWTGQWGKGVVDREDYKTITGSLLIYKRELLKREFIDIMHKVNPKDYPAKFEAWSNKTLGKTIVEKEDYKAMEQSLLDNRQKLKEREKAELLSQKESELKQLSTKDKIINEQAEELAKLKELLRIEKLEKQELFAQKEAELHDKSFAKNEIIEDLAETVALKDARINDLQLLNKELSHIPVGIQMGGIEEASQTTGVALIGDDIDIVLFH